MFRAPLLALLLSLPPAAAAAQAASPPVQPGSALAPRLDARLIVTTSVARHTTAPIADVVTRPRWHYPAIGAAVGAGAGLVHAYQLTRGYIEWPVEPKHILPVLYGAVGAFVGFVVDSAERERAAAR